MKGEGHDQACQTLASHQYGVLGKGQARTKGLTDDAVYYRVRSGRWEPLLPGVFRVAGAPNSWHQQLMAACLWAGEGAAASHRSAAALWRLEGFGTGPVEISAPKKPHRGVPDLVVHRVALADSDVTMAQAIPVTSPTRTLIDLGAVVEAESVERALDDALRRDLTSVPRLRWAVGRSGGRGRRGVGVLRKLLWEKVPGQAPAASVLEARLLRLLRGSGLPEPVRQHEIRQCGRLIARVDLAYPEVRLAVEADGYRYHSGKAAWQHDRARRNALTALGWGVLHVTWEDLSRRPKRILAEIGASLVATSRNPRSERQRS
ncbi:MAG: DUF559 domain-containing protein [Actinomycetota bacterium]